MKVDTGIRLNQLRELSDGNFIIKAKREEKIDRLVVKAITAEGCSKSVCKNISLEQEADGAINIWHLELDKSLDLLIEELAKNGKAER